jgi:predicted acyltransferase
MAALVEINPLQAEAEESTEVKRLVSLDALRGFDMFWILGGDSVIRAMPAAYDSRFTRLLAGQMEHCEWAGFHFYDLIFPLFVFIVGVSLVFSVRRTIARAGLRGAIKRIVVRSLLLFVLGIVYMGGVANGFENMYFAGVLHRIAVAYCFGALMFCFLGTEETRGTEGTKIPKRFGMMVGICLALLIGYWALLTFVPVPGVGTPSLAGPGRNLAHYIDSLYLPGRHFEGTVLSTMAAVANCLLGVFAGLLLESSEVSPQRKVYWLGGAGLIGLAAGFCWAVEFPIIKLLWTSSYVLVACGYGVLLLACFYQIMEVWHFQKWAKPFIWIGMNALPLYLIANIINFHHLAERFVGGDIHHSLGRFGELTTSSAALCLVLWLAGFLHRRKIFLRL